MAMEILFKGHPDPVWIVDPATGRIRAANRAACARYGYSESEFEGLHLSSLALPGAAPSASEPGSHLSKDGDRIDLRLDIGTVEWDGQPADIVVGRILPRQEELESDALKAVERRESLLRDGLRLGGFALWDYDAAQDRLIWSPRMREIFGVPVNEITGTAQELLDRVHPEDIPKLMEERENAMREGRVFDLEHRIVRPDGEVRHVRQIARFDDGPDGQLRRGLCQDVTESRRAEEERKAAELLLNLAGRLARFSGWQVTLPDERITWAAGMSEIHGTAPGWTPQGLHAAVEFYAPEDRARIRDAFAACARDGLPFDGVYGFRSADGNAKWVRVVGIPDRGHDGTISAVNGAMQDISELTEAQMHSRRLSQRLKETLAHISDGFFLLNPDFTFAYLNGVAEQLLERKLKDVEGRSIWEEFPEAEPILREKYAQAMQTGESFSIEYHYPPLDAWFRAKAHPIAEGLAVHFVDISLQRARDQTLRLLDSAVAQLSDIVMITDADTIDAPDGPRIIWVNDAFERVTGYSRAEAVGNTPRLLQGVDTDRAELDRIRTALDNRLPVRSQLVNYHKDGSAYWLELEIAPVTGDGGHVTHFIAVERDVTERKKVEAALRESELRFQLVAKAANDVIFDYDVVRDHVWWSDAMLHVFGHAPNSGSGALGYWASYVHPEDLAESHASRMRAFEGGAGEWVGEYRFRRADGSYASVVDRGLILRDKAGRPIRWVGSMIDVSALRESEERFRQAAIAAHDVIFSYDFLTDQHWWSEAIHSYYGHPRRDGRGTLDSWIDLIHPEDREEVLSSHRQAAGSDAETWTGSYRFLRGDGSHAHVIDRAFFIRDAKGRALKSVGSIVDVTPLRENEQRLRAMAQVASDAVYDYDPIKEQVYYSEGIRKAFGHSWIGQMPTPSPWVECVHPDDIGRASERFRDFLSGSDEHLKFEYRLRRADGRYALVVETVVALRDDAGRATRVIGSLQDVTAEREMEERLRQSQRLEAVGQLTGGVSHDFNNLLTIILGNAEILQDSAALPESLRGMAAAIATAADRGAELTNNLLAFARKQPLNPRPLDLKGLFNDVERLLDRTLPASIDVRILPEPGLWLANADRAQLTTALINLALNARDAMPEGGQLTIECGNAILDESQTRAFPEARPGDYLRITVSDTGVGMTRDVHERAFDPFFTTKPPGQGSGMGLSMVYGFTRQSGGHARIYSEPGQGTTVSIYLPRSHAAAADAALRTETAAVPFGGGELVLVVEDDTLLRSHVQDTVAGLGYRVSVAANADEALEVLDRQPDIAVLLTDIVMPGTMDGWKLAEVAKARYPYLKVLFTSGYTESAIMHRGRLEEGVSLLSKPYRREELAWKLHMVATS